MATVYVGLGTNLGDREAHLAGALDRLAEAEQVEVAAVSPVYDSEPAGYRDQPRFLNLVARLETELPPETLLERVQGIEAAMGRERTFPNAPRIIDIDLLVYEGETRDGPGLRLPHPRMAKRDFVLRPLVDLAPGLRLPGGTVWSLLGEGGLVGRAERYRPTGELRRWADRDQTQDGAAER